MTDGSRPRVLAVDDEEGMRDLLRRMLEPVGYDVRTAESAESALAMMTTFFPSVVLIDVHMPGRDGIWLTEQIRRAAPRVAMVLATADADIPPTSSFKPGIIEYLVKPFDHKAVLDAVARGVDFAEGRAAAPAPVSAPHPATTLGLGRGRMPRPAFWVALLLGAAIVFGIYHYLSCDLSPTVCQRVLPTQDRG